MINLSICFFLILGQNVTLTDFFPPPLWWHYFLQINFTIGSALFTMHFRFLVARWRNTQLWQAHKTGSKTLQRITTSTVSSLFLARLSLSALAHRETLSSRSAPFRPHTEITKTNGCWHQQFHFLIHLIPPLWCWGDVPGIRHYCLLNKPSDGALSLLPQKWP